MTQDAIIEMAHQASKLWMKEYPAPADCANPVPKRYLEIFAKLVAAKEREACAKTAEAWPFSTPEQIAVRIRARGDNQ